MFPQTLPRDVMFLSVKPSRAQHVTTLSARLHKSLVSSFIAHWSEYHLFTHRGRQ